MADTPLYARLSGEPSRAYAAFQIYRDLGAGKRSLSAVCEQLAEQSRGSGIRIESHDQALNRPKKPKHTGQISLWSRKYRWVERASEWDRLLDARLRQKHLDEIEAMAKRQAQQAQLGLEALMAPVLALARALRDPNRLVDLETAPLGTLLELAQDSLRSVPRLQRAERLARGVKIVDTEPVSNPLSTQGGATWNVKVHQPERTEEQAAEAKAETKEPAEWEEAK